MVRLRFSLGLAATADGRETFTCRSGERRTKNHIVVGSPFAVRGMDRAGRRGCSTDESLLRDR